MSLGGGSEAVRIPILGRREQVAAGSNGQVIIATTSCTGRTIENIFGSVEVAPSVVGALNRTSGDLEITLPRLQLSFKLGQEKSDILSKEFQAVSVDGNRAIGTLIGLRNKIV